MRSGNLWFTCMSEQQTMMYLLVISTSVISRKTLCKVRAPECGPGSSVSTVTAYGLDGPGIESWWGRDFPHPSRPDPGPAQPPVQRVPGLSLGKKWPGRDADPSPPSSAIGHERVELYLYSPYGPYGLYRTSVPVQGCTLLFTFTSTCM